MSVSNCKRKYCMYCHHWRWHYWSPWGNGGLNKKCHFSFISPDKQNKRRHTTLLSKLRQTKFYFKSLFSTSLKQDTVFSNLLEWKNGELWHFSYIPVAQKQQNNIWRQTKLLYDQSDRQKLVTQKISLSLVFHGINIMDQLFI